MTADAPEAGTEAGGGGLARTPLHEEHVRLDAKLVPFAGFAMPIQYPTGIRAEHRAVRERAGLFDVSHMGEFRVRGPEAVDFLARMTTNDPTRLETGQAQYTVMCLEDGGIVDDLLVYRLGEEDYRLVVNAANIDRDRAHLEERRGGFDAELEDESEEVALLALQGPRAEEILERLTPAELPGIGFYRFVRSEVTGVPAVVSRTGYTGEDGFELYLRADAAPAVWRRLLEEGSAAGIAPAGLGARDTLRLEMGYALYGNDIDEETTPLEAGLSWLVKLEAADFVGRDALRRQKEEGPSRRLRGFRLTERGFPRPGYELVFGGEAVGEVRSGTVSPTLGYGIGTVYLPSDAEVGDEVRVRIRERAVRGEVARLPFYTEGSLKR